MIDALQRLVQSLEDDAALLHPGSLHHRLEALDALDALLEPGHELQLAADIACEAEEAGDAGALCRRAQRLQSRLEALNEASYVAIRLEIQQGTGTTALLRWLASSTMASGDGPVTGMGYDSLDEVIRGVFAFDGPASQPASLGLEMVFYQPTPVRHILRLIGLAALTTADVLVDLGSGLGHVPLLVGICTTAVSIGIELEASYVDCARRCGERLLLRRVSFVQQDARTADLSSGTVFYLHTPFTGSIMRSVLDRLRCEAATRRLRICTYGPCTAAVAEEQWLQATTGIETDQIAVFTSIP